MAVRHVPGVEAADSGVSPLPGIAAPGARVFACATCGASLNGDLDEDPTGDAGRPICGECERSRNFDADLQLMDEEDRR